jgi:hypothetical protein
MKRFEYKTILTSRKSDIWEGIEINIPQLEIVLEQMGQEGWELVTSIEESSGEINRQFCMIFKREIQAS